MNKLRILLSLPKTVWLNFRHLPFKQAIKLPLFISYDTDISVKGKIVIEGNVRTAMIRMGFLCALACDTKEQTRLCIQKNGILRFLGEAHIGHGTRLIVRSNAKMTLGDNFAVSSNSTIQCYEKITFGRDIQFAWDCLVMDSDTHSIYDPEGNWMNPPKEIVFGDKVWIGCRSTILKGTIIPSNSVIGACSFVTGSKFDDNTIIAGSPAKSIKCIGSWKL